MLRKTDVLLAITGECLKSVYKYQIIRLWKVQVGPKVSTCYQQIRTLFACLTIVLE
jgi:hypothetical protein